MAPDTDGTQLADDFDPTDSANLDPHALYRRLRDSCPVAHSNQYGGFWALTRYQDVTQAVTHPEVFTSRYGVVVPRNPASGRRPPLHYDPPEHTVYRKAINPAFRKDRLRRLEPAIRQRSRQLIEALVGRGGGDFFSEVASPLCAFTVCGLMRVPDHLHERVSHEMEAFEAAQRADDAEAVESLNLALYDAARQIVALRDAQPLDPAEDIISALKQVTIDGRLIDEETVVGSVRQILIAGHGAPALALSSAAWYLARHPDLQQYLRLTPADLPAAVEELLRLYTPNQGFARTTTRDVEIGGRTIPQGERVAIVYTSANRDSDLFERPEEFIMGRSQRHLAFGYGVHVCPGSHLGRIQIRIALQELLTRTAAFELAGQAHFSGWPVYGPTSLPLRATPAVRPPDVTVSRRTGRRKGK